MPEMITRAHLVRQLLDMGVQPGRCWWSTPPFQRCGRWKAGRRGLIAALREALGAGRYAGDARHDRGRRPPL